MKESIQKIIIKQSLLVIQTKRQDWGKKGVVSVAAFILLICCLTDFPVFVYPSQFTSQFDNLTKDVFKQKLFFFFLVQLIETLRNNTDL